MSMYPDVRLTADGVQIGDQFIKLDWLKGFPHVVSEHGYFCKLTLDLWVNNLQVDHDADWISGEKCECE